MPRSNPAPHAPGDGPLQPTDRLRVRDDSGRERLRFTEYLAAKKLKLTRQRAAVLNAVFTDGGHFEAEAIVQRLKADRARVSRATVYRTLELLKECQLVEKHDFGAPQSFYEHIQPGQHHDHLICERCGNVMEFHNERLEHLQSVICRNFDFQETHHSLRIFGICSKCRQSAN
jgi:Fur family ferric uptake transcriptional regulator